ncbi:MAG: prolipoprotein diacylglyceryl transferase [Flavobacteriales bacterium]
MYPTFYELFLDLFGVSVPAFKYMQSYGMMVGLGFIVASVLVTYELRRKEQLGLLPPVKKDKKDIKKAGDSGFVHAEEHVGNIAIIVGFGAIVGGKLFHNLENWDEVVADPVGALTRMSGFSYYGGMILSMSLFVWYARKHKLSTIHVFDAVMPALALAYGFGRLGCHVSGDGDWGIPNDNPMPEWMSFLPEWVWAYDYPNNVLGVDLITYYASKGYTSLTGMAYPTPIYEILMSIVIFAILMAMRKRWTVPGTMISGYFILAGIERLIIERIRINNEYDILGGITQAEIISTIMIVFGVLGFYYLPKGAGARWAKF